MAATNGILGESQPDQLRPNPQEAETLYGLVLDYSACLNLSHRP